MSISQIAKVLLITSLFTLLTSHSCEKVDQLDPDLALIRIEDNEGLNELHFPKIVALDSNDLYIFNKNGELIGQEHISIKDSSKCYLRFERVLGVDTDWLYDYYLKKISDSTFYLIKAGFAAGELDCEVEAQLNSLFFEHQEYRLYDYNSAQP